MNYSSNKLFMRMRSHVPHTVFTLRGKPGQYGDVRNDPRLVRCSLKKMFALD